jgi:hypothetical protein
MSALARPHADDNPAMMEPGRARQKLITSMTYAMACIARPDRDTRDDERPRAKPGAGE